MEKDRPRELIENLARRTPRRSFIGRTAGAAFGVLAAAAAGVMGKGAGDVEAVVRVSCFPPFSNTCRCEYCNGGACKKPCSYNTTWYASGCWVSTTGALCCDCTCPGPQTSNRKEGTGVCGCASDICP